MPSLPFGHLLVASIIAGLLGFGSVLLTPEQNKITTNVYLDTTNSTLTINETFTVDVVIEAVEPVNVYSGIVVFNSEKLRVEEINYNISIADLWAEEPWYSNGDGTISFVGGTTQAGGFTGKKSLLSITFSTVAAGEAIISMKDIRILKHDGLGTDSIVNSPLESIFTINQEKVGLEEKTTLSTPNIQTIQIVPQDKSTDLNGDGKQTVADISIFMTHLATQNLRSDFNTDGKVTLKDLSILMQD